MSQPPGNTTDTKHYKVLMGIKGRISPEGKALKGASVFFFVDVKYDSAGKPIEAHTTPEKKSELSISERIGLGGEYKSVDAENVCHFVGHSET